jgi:hypothetical protein
MPKYSETHHLNIDDAGLASVHVAVHLQDADPRIARLLVLRVLDAASTIAYLDPVILPQTSGPCVHYDEDEDGHCAYPYDQPCPHLDNPDVLCPIKDACYAMRAVARLRDVCEAEQGEQDADMAAVAPSQTYETAAPEWVEPAPDDGVLHTYTVPATRKPTNPNAWSGEEIEVIRRAQSAAEAERLYSETYGIWKRSRSAVTTRWYKLRAAGELIAPAPTLDFVGDTTPVTQCDEEPVFTVPHPTYRPGDRVRIKHALHRGQTGKIERYFPATENYLVAIDGMPDMIVLTDAQMEAV